MVRVVICHAVVVHGAVISRHAMVGRVMVSSKWPIVIRECRVTLTVVMIVVASVVIEAGIIAPSVILVGAIAVIVL